MTGEQQRRNTQVWIDVRQMYWKMIKRLGDLYDMDERRATIHYLQELLESERLKLLEEQRNTYDWKYRFKNNNI